MGRGAWRAAFHGITESDTTERARVCERAHTHTERDAVCTVNTELWKQGDLGACIF